jgi:hypothetical protein
MLYNFSGSVSVTRIKEGVRVSEFKRKGEWVKVRSFLTPSNPILASLDIAEDGYTIYRCRVKVGFLG